MNFDITRPAALWLLVLVIPATVFFLTWFRRLSLSLGILYGERTKTASLWRKLKIRLIMRTFFWILSYSSLVLSFCGIYWGTEAVPVSKNGHSVSLVFDISYSMNAQDVPYSGVGSASGGGRAACVSRLEAAKSYALSLLPHLEGTALSLVIAKGDGVIAVPLTEDLVSFEAIIPALNPSLMTSAGSCIGKGIDVAVQSFPQNSSRSSAIIVFTDGDETDGYLESSCQKAAEYGIPILLVGFGSTEGTSVLSGDGKTLVTSALQAENLKSIAESVSAKTRAHLQFSGKKHKAVQFVDANEKGSAIKVLEAVSSYGSTKDEMDTFTGYEIKPIARYRLFIAISIILFIAGFCTIEFRKPLFRLGTIALIALLFTSCSANLKSASRILEGQYYWLQNDFEKSTASFLQVIEDESQKPDSTLIDYALFGLSSSYVMMNENEAAMEKLVQINTNSNYDILFGIAYNSGCIYFKQGKYNEAAQCFKNALLIDNSSIEAKVNLELSQNRHKEQVKSKLGTQEMIPTAEEPSSDSNILENTLFSIIRENDQNRWKNQQSTNAAPSADDF